MSFLDGYEPVEERLARFWNEHPTGRVHTELVAAPDGQYIFRAEVYRDADDPRPYATGYAHETETQRGVNATSALENCETSAVGRALANAGYAPKGKRPSREEMGKVSRAGGANTASASPPAGQRRGRATRPVNAPGGDSGEGGPQPSEFAPEADRVAVRDRARQLSEMGLDVAAACKAVGLPPVMNCSAAELERWSGLLDDLYAMRPMTGDAA